jgi:hypothetical protein
MKNSISLLKTIKKILIMINNIKIIMELKKKKVYINLIML